MIRVLALDLATVTGFAVDRPDGNGGPLTGTVTCKHIGNDFGPAYVALERFMLDAITVHGVTHCAFEAPLVMASSRDGRKVQTNVATVRKLMGLAAVAELVGARAGLQVFEANVQSARRHFAGSGHAKKPEVYQRCRLLGWDVKSHDAADAAAVWSMAKSLLDPKWSPRSTPLYGRPGA